MVEKKCMQRKVESDGVGEELAPICLFLVLLSQIFIHDSVDFLSLFFLIF